MRKDLLEVPESLALAEEPFDRIRLYSCAPGSDCFDQLFVGAVPFLHGRNRTGVGLANGLLCRTEKQLDWVEVLSFGRQKKQTATLSSGL